ncbi:MAG: porin family protein [Bacteroides sp.]|nr:porin family protein [Bacteroidales bacterium]MBD5250129.1 porin family protein [Barnesiella sp.]MBD5253348.1 porin family protein [Barnesiella sp.]MBD5344464.1 porin family protein [Bacteroides sp.]MBD5368123.1 porin family protein [Bacteroides sp.]
MKKFLVMAVMAIMAVAASAQVYVGGSLGYTHQKLDEGNTDVFTFAPEVGYNLNSTWAVGGSLNYTWTKDVSNQFYINPYARYTFFHSELVNLFVDGSVDLGISAPKEGDSSTIWGIGLKPGLSLNLNKKFSLVAHVGFLGYRDLADAGKVYGINIDNNITFGFYYNF